MNDARYLDGHLRGQVIKKLGANQVISNIKKSV